MCILMIALVCTAVQEEVLGVRCKLMLQFLQKAQGRIDTESGRSDHFDFLNAKFGVPAEEVEGGVDLSDCRSRRRARRLMRRAAGGLF